MTLNGTLEDFSPAGILKVLSDDGRTGAVRFAGERGCTVYLHRGQLYFARNERTDEALATAMSTVSARRTRKPAPTPSDLRGM